VKKASPSRGVLAERFDPLALAGLYADHGAAALSVLTDEKYFQGSLGFLTAIRERVGVPILRKDFTLDEYQVWEARAAGADAVLLIVSILDAARLRDLGQAAAGLGLAALVLPLLHSHFRGGLTMGDEYVFFFTHYSWFVAAAAAIFYGCAIGNSLRFASEWRPRLGGFVMTLSVVVGLLVTVQWHTTFGGAPVDATRNFYGTLHVYEYDSEQPENRYYLLLHGATTHGLQFAAEDKAMRHTTYYGETSGVGLAIKNLPRPPGERRIGLVGLGTGTLASYGTPGDYLRIYEINPAVVHLSQTRFSYVRRCPAKVDIVLGDARLSMERELKENHPQQFDLLALDAFSSDAIPVHLLTKEAFAIYLRELKPDGVIAVHVSNRYLDLQPIVERLAAEHGLIAATVSDDEEHESWVYRTTWILVTRNKALLETPEIGAVAKIAGDEARHQTLWTDDYASLYKVMR